MDFASPSWSDDGGSPPELPDLDLIRRVGRGGFGDVWLAKNRATGAMRAVKVIPVREFGKTDPAGRETTSLMLLERIARRRHPNLLTIHHVGRTDRWLFYIMDLADDLHGEKVPESTDYKPATLERRLQHGPLPPEECLRHVEGLLSGLACLHEAGMVHRDVKPANCLFVDGRLQLADYGLLTNVSEQVSRIGTLRYMPPDGRMDARADVYAAGLVIYEMITGRLADTFPSLAEQAIPVANNEVLRRLNQLALRACEIKPDRRFRDAVDMHANLIGIVPHALASGARVSRRVATWVVSVVGAAALVLGSIWLIWPKRVFVNFITEPYYEAVIVVDGEIIRDVAGREYRTPCTVEMPQGVHHVVFQLEAFPDLEIGDVDFSQTPEIIGRWETQR